MSNTQDNNNFLVNIQETEAKAEKMEQAALEKKQKTVAESRVERENQKQETLKTLRAKNAKEIETAETKAESKRVTLVEQHKAETESFKADKKSAAEKLNAGALENLIAAMAA